MSGVMFIFEFNVVRGGMWCSMDVDVLVGL